MNELEEAYTAWMTAKLQCQNAIHDDDIGGGQFYLMVQECNQLRDIYEHIRSGLSEESAGN